jgi:hypothetical protein
MTKLEIMGTLELLESLFVNTSEDKKHYESIRKIIEDYASNFTITKVDDEEWQFDIVLIDGLTRMSFTYDSENIIKQLEKNLNSIVKSFKRFASIEANQPE